MDPVMHHAALAAITFQLSLLLPTLMSIIRRYYMKEPYHTSILCKGLTKCDIGKDNDASRCY